MQPRTSHRSILEDASQLQQISVVVKSGPGSVVKHDQQRSGGFPDFPLLEDLLSILLSVLALT